ncbi:tumor necrosis factor receptor superfamily member 6 isoform X2 [Cavia porcellus]|uniref:tumor necrosis factor receptor superfamily member 6 isoform X2 n=1 Tax=Cavia porcellus TaxID=10141 RepID=UPI002FE1DD82
MRSATPRPADAESRLSGYHRARSRRGASRHVGPAWRLRGRRRGSPGRRAGGLSGLVLAAGSEVFTFIPGPLSKTANARGIDTSSEGLKLKREITKTETQCTEDRHPVGQFCCRLCPPGTKKAADCTSDENETHCVPCKEGNEYTDKQHYSSQCRRCTFCDAGHGLEVERNCTRTQDTKCRCKSNFYCSSPVCEHCDPCIRCEHGIIEECTPTSNTKCKEESSSANLLWLLLLLPFGGLVLGLCIYKKYFRNNRSCHGYTFPRSETEGEPPNFSDVEFSKHIPKITEIMTINEVREFVRKNGVPEAKIDDIKNDNQQDTGEQKVQLLRSWYQLNGKKNACQIFIKSLEEDNFKAYSQKVQDIFWADVRSNQENSNSTSENERQSLA